MSIDLSKFPDNYVTCYKYLYEKLPDELKNVKMAIVCGSGLNNLADKIKNTVVFDYKKFFFKKIKIKKKKKKKKKKKYIIYWK